MTKKHSDEWSEINQSVQKQHDDKRQTIYHELKRTGQVENPVKYTETHLEGGEENMET